MMLTRAFHPNLNVPPLDCCFAEQLAGTGHPQRMSDGREELLNIHRRIFRPEEDRALVAVVGSGQYATWLEIAQQIPGRSPRQCRDRWTNYLAPTISLDPWTPAEDSLIMRSVEMFGMKWATIAKLIPGRTDNAVKNRWYTALKWKAADGAARPPRRKGDPQGAPEPPGAPAEGAPAPPTPEQEVMPGGSRDFWDRQFDLAIGAKADGEKRDRQGEFFTDWF